MSNGSYIDGIASSQAIDTAGEVVDIAGMDISSLVGSVFNYEHKSDIPAQIVGKILYAKKIFDEKDCENDRQLKFWNKCKLPYLYVMGQLFDEFSPSAQEIAGVFQYDSQNPDKDPTVGFSIEGSKISKEGMIVNRSIARKVTITVAPANKTCLAELVQPETQEQPQDDLSSIFKTEISSSIDLIKAEDAAKILGIPMNKAENEYHKGSVIGTTTSGKSVYSHGPVHASGFSPDEHKEAAQMHFDAANKIKNNPQMAQTHYDKFKLHQKQFNNANARQQKIQETQTAQTAAKAPALSRYGKLHDPRLSGTSEPKMKKALDAGSAMAAPGQLNQGSALAKESLDKKMKKDEKGVHMPVNNSQRAAAGKSAAGMEARPGGSPAMARAAHSQKLAELKSMPKPKLTKSNALKRAEEVYKAWNKRSEFEKFMKERMPSLTKGEITAIGQTVALNQALTEEEALADLVGYEKPKSK